jgi:RalA-binding protein 1
MPPPSHAPPQPPQQQPQYAGYETGFIPMRPSYEAPAYEQQYQQTDGYGSLNGAKGGSAREQRQRKRESGMLLMNMGMSQPRKGSNGSNPPARDYRGHQNPLLIREETAFE